LGWWKDTDEIMIFNKKLEDIEESVLQYLVDNQVSEQKMLSTKRPYRATPMEIKRYLDALQNLGVEPPLFVMMSLHGIESYRLEHYSLNEPSGQIDRPDLVVAEILIDRIDVDVTKGCHTKCCVWNL
jgi:hypothetical protein